MIIFKIVIIVVLILIIINQFAILMVAFTPVLPPIRILSISGYMKWMIPTSLLPPQILKNLSTRNFNTWHLKVLHLPGVHNAQFTLDVEELRVRGNIQDVISTDKIIHGHGGHTEKIR